MSENETYANWRLERDDAGICWLCIDKADGSANVLSEPVLRELDEILGELGPEPPTGLVIYSGKESGFIMGADINEFTTIESADKAFELVRLGQEMINRLAALDCPTVAVIDGFALGGGLELALACDYRIAMPNRKSVIGLPEVQLGLHPGFGGTVRSVQIMGVRAAMPLMLTGKPIRVDKAKRQGLVDRITSTEKWRDEARNMVKSRPQHLRAPFVDRLLNLAPLRPFVARMLRAQVRSKARPDHYPAPYAIIDLWSRHGASPATGYEAEARSFADLMVTDTSRNLVRVFFLQNRLKGQGGKPPRKIGKVHVIGAGVMGGDIAAWCALRGLDVTLQDREEQYVAPALERAERLFEKRIRDAEERSAAKSRLRPDVPGDGVAGADLIIEAIFEDLDAKQALYRKVGETMRSDAILATNTSSIRLEELRTVVERPRRFIGLHFFNPVAQLPLVEVIRCEDTEQDALDEGFAFVKAIGKYPLECMSAPGFVVNRLLAPYMAEAMHLLEAGVPLASIDRAAEDFGMPMGPVELVDSVGIDVALHVSKVLGAAFGRPVPARLGEMVERGDKGRKSGQGFYRWEDGKAIKPPPGDAPVPGDLIDRLILPMVNEAVACLDEGVVADADLLDAGVIFGTGFAPFRGGPLQYARQRGVDDVVAKLEGLAAAHGDRYAPHAGWAALETGRG